MKQADFYSVTRDIGVATEQTAIDTANGNLTSIEIEIPDNCNLVAIGDLHGEYADFCAKFSAIDVAPETTYYVFLGDLIDGRVKETRNEVALLQKIARLKVERPGRVHMLLGNHELVAMQGKRPETPRFVNARLWDEYSGSKEEKQAFATALVNWYLVSPILLVATRGQKRIAFVHGGPGFSIQKEIDSKTIEFSFPDDCVYNLKVLNSVEKRPVFASRVPGLAKEKQNAMVPGSDYSFHQALKDLMWSDVTTIGNVCPSPNKHNKLRKKYGPIASAKFLAVNKLDFLVRGHQPRLTDFLDTKTLRIVSKNYNVHESHGNKVITIHHSTRDDLRPLYTCILMWRANTSDVVEIIRDDLMEKISSVRFDTHTVETNDVCVSRYIATGGKIGRVASVGYPEKPYVQRMVIEKVISMCEPGDVLLFAGDSPEKHTDLIRFFTGQMTHAAIIAIDETISGNRAEPGGKNVVVLESNRYPETSTVMKYDYFKKKATSKEIEESLLAKTNEQQRAFMRRLIMSRLFDDAKASHGRTDASHKSDDDLARVKAMEIMGSGKFRPRELWSTKLSGVRSACLRDFLQYYDGQIYLCKLPQKVVDCIPGGRQTLNYRILKTFGDMYHMQFEENLVSFVNVAIHKPFRNKNNNTVYCSEFVAEVLQRSGIQLNKYNQPELYTPADFDNSSDKGGLIVSRVPLKLRAGEICGWMEIEKPLRMFHENDEEIHHVIGPKLQAIKLPKENI